MNSGQRSRIRWISDDQRYRHSENGTGNIDIGLGKKGPRRPSESHVVYGSSAHIQPLRRAKRTAFRAKLEAQGELLQDMVVPSFASTTPDGSELLSSCVGQGKSEAKFLRFLDDGIQKWNSRQAATDGVTRTSYVAGR